MTPLFSIEANVRQPKDSVMQGFLRISKRHGVLALLTAGVVMTQGCSSEPAGYTVTGTVKMAGRPLCYVGLRFYDPKAGEGLVAPVDAAGEFATPTPLKPGFYEVSIAARPPGGNDPNAPPASPAPPDDVPRHYLVGATSSLTAHVSETETRFDFSLSDKELTAKQKKARGPVVFARGM